MARPAALQFLKKGMLLAGKVFPQFVATWNWLVRAFDNLCGDADLNVQQGYISVDRTNPDRPVIRFDVRRVANSGLFSNGRFTISRDNGSIVYRNCYYSVGGKTYDMGDQYGSESDGIEALKILARPPSSQQEAQAQIAHYADVAALNADQADVTYYVIPLYTFKQGSVTCDWRIGPDAAMGEF